MSQLEFGDINKEDTLAVERDRIKATRDEGTHCRACGQYCKVYPRRIHSTIAKTLIVMSRKYGLNYFHNNEIYQKIPNARGDFYKCVLWGLIEPKPFEGERDDGLSRNGMWRMTVKGIDFVSRQIRISKIVYLYDGKVLGFGAEEVDIVDCLKNKFSYEELMGKKYE